MGTCGGYTMDSERLEEETVSEEDVIEEVEDDELSEDEVEENDRFRKKCNMFQRVLLFVNALILCGCLYINRCTYYPEERELLEDNLFSGNDVIASDEMLRDIVKALEDELNVSISEEDKDEYYLLNAILKNPNLSDSEKDLFYNYIDLIKDNPYLDKEEAYNSLLNVDILYEARPLIYDRDVLGVYIYDLESIGVFDDDEEKSTLIHEGIHCIYCNEKTYDLPTYFKEGMTELLANEYFSSSPFVELKSYPFEVAAVKMLCEVTSTDTVLKAFSLGDMGIIAEEIASVTGNYDEAVVALEMLDYALLWHNDEIPKDREIISDMNVVISGFIPTFRECITLKYDELNRNRISYFYNEILFANIFGDEPYTEYVDDLVEFGSDHKAYFSSKLKQKVAADEVINKIGEQLEEVNVKTLEKEQ